MEKEKIESLLILLFFYTFIVVSAILVSMRFNELSAKGYNDINNSSTQYSYRD
ncbi:MAG: hypothetical protein ACI31M_03490 [Bacilli bacterium]